MLGTGAEMPRNTSGWGGASGDLSALYWLIVLGIPLTINQGLFKRKRAREKQVIK